ncbi:MAG: MBL fold metallo-hydrolase [Promethearchaeota archaeon]
MKIQELEIQIIVDNTSGPDGTLSESGFSSLINIRFADSTKSILFDTGMTPVAFLNNVKKLKVDLTTIDAIVLSHGHFDHVGGLDEAISLTGKKIPLICHPHALLPKNFRNKGKIYDIGIKSKIKSIDDLKKKTNLITTTDPYYFTESVMTTGEITRKNDYEVLSGGLTRITTVENGKIIPDELIDDLSMVFHLENDNIIILTGCCHSGIVNTISRATQLTKSKKIIGIVGGLHLHDASDLRLSKTVQELKKYPIQLMAPCHCTGLRGKCAIMTAFGKKFLEATVSTKILVKNGEIKIH